MLEKRYREYKTRGKENRKRTYPKLALGPLIIQKKEIPNIPGMTIEGINPNPGSFKSAVASMITDGS